MASIPVRTSHVPATVNEWTHTETLLKYKNVNRAIICPTCVAVLRLPLTIHLLHIAGHPHRLGVLFRALALASAVPQGTDARHPEYEAPLPGPGWSGCISEGIFQEASPAFGISS